MATCEREFITRFREVDAACDVRVNGDSALTLGAGGLKSAGVTASNQILSGLGLTRYAAMPAEFVNFIEMSYPNKDIESRLTTIGITSSTGKSNYRMLLATLMGLDVLGDLSNGFLFGSAHQTSSSTAKSINGGSDATGTSTSQTYGAALNGTTNGFTYLAASASATRAGKTLIAVFSDANITTGHISHVLSGYSGGASKGPAIYSGGSSLSGTSDANRARVFGFVSADGTATTEVIIPSATAGRIVYAATVFDGAANTAFIHGRDPVYSALAGSIWDNSATYAIGKNPAGAVFLSGVVHAVLEFNAALTPNQITTIQQVLRLIFAAAETSEPKLCLFSGNSLTESASGGGSNWPTKLMDNAAWAAQYPSTHWLNVALSGTTVTGYGEFDYYMRGSRMRPVRSEESISFVWEGINDITAGLSANTIIASINRHCTKMLIDGWRVVLMTLTPVADAGSGMAYGYTPEQQAVLTGVNNWILSQTQFNPLNLSLIGEEYPEFLDPTDSTYYVAGDGLHQNDAGRVLIANYVNSVVQP